MHAVLERLFDLPASERTIDAAVGLVPQEWERLADEEPAMLDLLAEHDGRTDEWFAGAATLLQTWFGLEDPTRLEPAERELYVETEIDGLVLRGYVDRLDVAPGGAMRVVDYKTGRSPSEHFEAKALFQMKFYALVLWRLRGASPSGCSWSTSATARSSPTSPTSRTCSAPSARSRRCGQAIERAADDRRLAPEPEPAVRLVRPPGPVPGLGWHAPAAARRRRERAIDPTVTGEAEPDDE